MKKAWLWIVLVSAALVADPLMLRIAEAGYSSGRSSVSRSRSSSSRSSSSSHRSSSSSHSSSSSSHSSSSGSRSSSSYSSGKGTSYSSGKGSSYSSGKGSSYTSPGSSGSSFGAAAASARHQEESRHYSSGATPPPLPGRSYSSGAAVVNYRNRQIGYLRSRLNAESYASRQMRMQRFYGGYYGRPVMGSYHDGYSPWFWLWLLDRPYHQQATWMYHHRYSMDPGRYNYLVNENAALRQQVADLEAQNAPRDPTYVPPELPEPDLMYADTYAVAATQPATTQPAAEESWTDGSDPADSGATGGSFASETYAPNVTTYHRQDSGWPGLFTGLFWVAVVGSVVAVVARLAGNKPSGGSAPFAPRYGGSGSGGYNAPPPPLRDGGYGSPAPPPLPPEQIDNPLDMRVGQRFTIGLDEYAGLGFVVEQILQYTTRVDGQAFRYTAYWGVARPEGQDKVVVQIRVERLAAGGLAVLAMRLHDQFEYSQDFYNIVATDGTGVFQITDDDTGAVTAEYQRVGGVLSAYTATAVPLNRSGESAGPRTVQFWDYSRSIDLPQGPGNEYLIVEMEESGWFRILVGPQVEPLTVSRERLN